MSIYPSYDFDIRQFELRMKASHQSKIHDIKQMLKNYMLEMFKSMSISFFSSLEDQFRKIEAVYRRCQHEKEELQEEVESITKMKIAINKMMSYLQQLEKQVLPSSIKTNIIKEYYPIQKRTQSQSKLTPSNSLISIGLNNTNDTPNRRFERKKSQRGILHTKEFNESQKENEQGNIFSKLYYPAPGPQEQRKLNRFLSKE